MSGRRHYDDSVLDRLHTIACAQHAGFTIAEIRQLIEGTEQGSGDWRLLARRKLTEVDAVIEKAQATRRLLERTLACSCPTLEQCAASGGC